MNVRLYNSRIQKRIRFVEYQCECVHAFPVCVFWVRLCVPVLCAWLLLQCVRFRYSILFFPQRNYRARTIIVCRQHIPTQSIGARADVMWLPPTTRDVRSRVCVLLFFLFVSRLLVACNTRVLCGIVIQRTAYVQWHNQRSHAANTNTRQCSHTKTNTLTRTHENSNCHQILM